MQRDEVVVQDIINAARLVIEFVKGFDKVWKTSTVDVPDLLSKIEAYSKK